MIHRIILFCVIAFFPSLGIDAQLTKKINAVIEDDKFLCILKSIDFYPDSTVATWKLKSKTRTSKFKLSEHVSIKEIETGISHKQITDSKDLQETIRFKKIYDIKEFKTCFPAINDSALISIYLSPTIYVDSLKLRSEDGLNEVYRYRVPLYKQKPLLTRADSISFSNEMYYNGINLFKKGNLQLAIISFEKSLAIERQLRLLRDWEYSSFFDNFNEKMWIANCYYKLGNLKEAEKYSNTYYVEPYDKKLRGKADSLEIKSMFIYDKEKLEILKKICKLDSCNIGMNSFRYAESLYDLAIHYSNLHKFEESKAILERAKKIITDKYNHQNWLLSSIYIEQSKMFYRENKVNLAIKFLRKAMSIEKDSIKIENDSRSFSNYVTLANYYRIAGNWEKGKDIMDKRTKYWRNLYEKAPHGICDAFWGYTWDHQHAYSDALSDYASYLFNCGLYKQALRKYKESINVRGTDLGWLEYRELGDYCFGIHDFDKALYYYEKAKIDYLSTFTDNKHDKLYLKIQNSIAGAYSRKSDMENAISIQKDIINNALVEVHENDSLFGKWKAGYEDYADYISNLARFYNLTQQYDSAVFCEMISLEIKKIYRPSENNLAYSYMNLGYSYAGKKIWNEALKYSLQANNIYDRKNDRKFYLRSLTDLSNCYFHLYRYTDLEKSIHEMMVVAGHALYSTIQELTYNERSRFIDEYSDLMNQKIPMYAYYTCSESIIEESYNASLIMKGALLNSENSVKRVIDDSEDNSLKSMWDEMKSDRYILSKELQRDSLERKLNVDSLQKVIYNLEDTIILKCKEYGDMTQSMKLKWQDIRKSLSSSDVAIEFLSFPIENDSVMYAALTLRKDDKSPKLISLFEEKQLKNISDSLCYQSKDMTQLVWGPLYPELQGVKNIYFSPSGALYNIGIEYLPGMEDYNIYRLSSTRELVNRRAINGNNRAVLYGGLDYEAKLDTLSQSRSRTRFNEKFVDHSDVRNMKYRGGQENLTHTLDEVEQIEKELKKTQWQCLLDTLSLGTEESFKSFSGKTINTLHIATHGFYYTPEESDDIGYAFLLPNDQMSAEDKSLSRSGLLMSGANHILDGDSIPEDVEDGILTAKEIADVDLRGLDMVVLSACQTGLGDISQGEGVFGLQRGFKKAGANSILMSLWEVNDEATQILMTQFYKNLVSGQSKRQSLRSAQRYLREYNKGCFDEPKYWAAFILLDGIDKN